MNKFAKTLCMMAVLALAFVSCKKTETTGYSFSFKGSVQQFENVYEGDFDRAYMNSAQPTNKFNSFCMT